MSRKKLEIIILLCLSLCSFSGCGGCVRGERAETGAETYTDMEKSSEPESDMIESRSTAKDVTKTEEKDETRRRQETEQDTQETVETQEDTTENVEEESGNGTVWEEPASVPPSAPTETAPMQPSSQELLTGGEIAEKNRISFGMAGNGMVDLDTFQPQSAAQIRSMIEAYQIPNYPYYGGRPRTAQDDQALLASRNLDSLQDPVNVRYGVIVSNAAVRSFPTDSAMTAGGSPGEFDYIQETMLGVGEGVVICHQTADQSYSFVQGYQYCGWIRTDCVGFCSREQMNEFIHPSSFVVVTDAAVYADNKKLRMGTRLPLAGDGGGEWYVTIPRPAPDGSLVTGIVGISKGSSHQGYLPYTEEGLLIQAQKMVGQPYGWGDMNENMDCSSTMNCIYKSFGILMPRNTSQLASSSATVIGLSGMGVEEKRAVIRQSGPGSMLLMPGHVVMYVGEENGISMIIHNVTGYSLDGGAVGAAMQCQRTPMDIFNTAGMNYMDLYTTLIRFG